MASSATLTSLTARVRAVLMDSGASIWQDSDITEALRQAMAEYSRSRPLLAVTTLTLAASGREISIASVTGLIGVAEVWCPYTAASPEDPPNLRPFSLAFDLGTIYVSGEYQPAAGDVLRLFYTKLQTLNGLDSATSSTFSAEDDSLLVTGACGFCTTTRGLDLTEKITIDSKITAQQVRAWGLGKLQEFRAALRDIARRHAGRGSSRVKLPGLDDWDRLRGQSGKKWS